VFSQVLVYSHHFSGLEIFYATKNRKVQYDRAVKLFLTSPCILRVVSEKMFQGDDVDNFPIFDIGETHCAIVRPASLDSDADYHKVDVVLEAPINRHIS